MCVSTAVSSCPDLTDLSTVHLPHFKLNFMITIKIIIIIITPPSHDIENSRSKEDATEPQVEHSLRLKRKSHKKNFFFLLPAADGTDSRGEVQFFMER